MNKAEQIYCLASIAAKSDGLAKLGFVDGTPTLIWVIPEVDKRRQIYFPTLSSSRKKERENPQNNGVQANISRFSPGQYAPLFIRREKEQFTNNKIIA